MNIEQFLEKQCSLAFEIIKKNIPEQRSSKEVREYLNRFRNITFNLIYSALLLNENDYYFKELYQELIIIFSEYDIKIKNLFY